MSDEKQEEKTKTELEKSLECSVCFYLLYEPRTFSCGHSICLTCQLGWEKQICPLCKKSSPVHQNIQLRNVCRDMFPQQYAEQKERFECFQIDNLSEKVKQEGVLWIVSDVNSAQNKKRLCHIWRHWYWTYKKKEPGQLDKWKMEEMLVLERPQQMPPKHDKPIDMLVFFNEHMYVFFRAPPKSQ